MYKFLYNKFDFGKINFFIDMFDLLLPYEHIKYGEITFDGILDKGNLIVYKGYYKNKYVAIKEYPIKDDKFDDSIINELDIGIGIRSSRLLKIYGYSMKKDMIYLIMEYINYNSLWKFINNDKYYVDCDLTNDPINSYIYDNGDGYKWYYIMERNLKKNITLSVIKSIKSMWNEHILHGDLKTQNLAIHKDDNNTYVKVIDYGTSYIGYESIENGGGGTDGYAAPEQDFNVGILNHKSDIYSLGVIITEIWVGCIWRGGDYFELCRNELLRALRILEKEEPKLGKIIRKCINLDHKKRPDIYKVYDMFNEV
jgi:serine/threonine protein kinase